MSIYRSEEGQIWNDQGESEGSEGDQGGGREREMLRWGRRARDRESKRSGMGEGGTENTGDEDRIGRMRKMRLREAVSRRDARYGDEGW